MASVKLKQLKETIELSDMINVQALYRGLLLKTQKRGAEMMEIRHLHTFLAIVDTGKFTKASEQLGYAQSTITSHIQILEDELGHRCLIGWGKK